MSRRRNAIGLIAASATIILAVAATVSWNGLRVNMTPSYPRGLWRIEVLDRPVTVGDLVFICPPRTAIFEQALARGYIRRGLCPGWLSPLIKTVAATPGQRVEIGISVAIDGRPLDHSDLRRIDAEGRPLMAFPNEVVPAGHLFLHSKFGGSYDSRYFGPIPAAGLLGLARPILTMGR